MTGSLVEDYRTCEVITREQARNFSYGIRLLPAQRRKALSAVYALARRIDDIGDGDLPAAAKLVELARIRRSLTGLSAGGASDPVLRAVADAATRYPIPLDAFGELLDGVEMDVAGRSYATFDELVDYCRCVAGSVGRLCLAVFGGDATPAAAAYADALGVALQQTNVLRDIREDLGNGRVYLPRQDLERFGVELRLDRRGVLCDPDGSLSVLIRYSAQRAQQWYDDGLRLVPLLDRRSAACCLAMAGIYRQLLGVIAATPSTVFDRRMSLSGRQKAAVAVRALSGTGR